MSVWDDIKNVLSDQGALGSVAHAVSDQGPLGQAGKDVLHFLGEQRVAPGSKTSFSQIPKALSDQSIEGALGISTKPSSAPKAKPAAAATSSDPPAQQNPYGFDPLSMQYIFAQAFAPYLQQNYQQAQGYIDNYGKQMQQALQGASPQTQAAFAQTIPALQQAMSQENLAAKNLPVLAPEVDSLISNLANATNAAKGAQQYASIAPYYSSLINGTALPGSVSPMITPFTYGNPSTQTAALQQTALSQQQLAQMASALTNPQTGG